MTKLHGLLAGIAVAVSIAGAIPLAYAQVSTDQLKAYSEIYPQFFGPSAHIQPVAYHPIAGGVGNRSQAVQLLLQSYNEQTNYGALESALGKGGSRAVTGVPAAEPGGGSALKSSEQIQRLLATKRLNWEAYETITREISQNPMVLKAFLAFLDRHQIRESLINRAKQDPMYVQTMGSSDHRVLAQKVIQYFDTVSQDP